MLAQVLLIYQISRTHRTNCFNFQSCFVRVDFGKFILLQIILLYIFTSLLFFVFRFHVSKELLIFSHIYLERLFSLLYVKYLGAYFQTKVRKRTVTTNRSTPGSLQINIQLCGYFSFHFGLSIRIELMLVAAIVIFPQLV